MDAELLSRVDAALRATVELDKLGPHEFTAHDYSKAKGVSYSYASKALRELCDRGGCEYREAKIQLGKPVRVYRLTA